MARPVTLFTGQWADLPLEGLAKKAAGWGYDGLELACWGDHFEVDKAMADDGYCKAKCELLAKHKLKVFAISSHLVGQAVCDNIDERHKTILPEDVWGDGEAEGVRQQIACWGPKALETPTERGGPRISQAAGLLEKTVVGE